MRTCPHCGKFIEKKKLILMVDESLIQKAKEYNLNISALVERYLAADIKLYEEEKKAKD